MGQDPSPLPFFSASICLPQSSVSPPHTTACLGIQPHLHIPLPRRSHSLSDLCCCHKPSYILPRVTKLPDASDKGSNPGTGTRRITSLAVCLSLIFTLVGSRTVTPANHEGCYDFFFLLLQTLSAGSLFPGHYLHCFPSLNVALKLLPKLPAAA